MAWAPGSFHRVLKSLEMKLVCRKACYVGEPRLSVSSHLVPLAWLQCWGQTYPSLPVFSVTSTREWLMSVTTASDWRCLMDSCLSGTQRCVDCILLLKG